MTDTDPSDIESRNQPMMPDCRDSDATRRDDTAHGRDAAADARDRTADERDRLAEGRDQLAERSEALLSSGMTANALHRSALARRASRSDRRRALQDRRAGASGRRLAEDDRNAALVDRSASAEDRESSAVDAATGVFRRDEGFAELDRDIARARRTGRSLVVAFIDVDHLKVVNDARGHAAGDAMLVAVTDALRAQIRAYDLIFRYGGDEFVCALSGLSIADAADRFARVNPTLAAAANGSVTVGLAVLGPEESASTVMARADAELYRQRPSRRDSA
jgi:diguanylate cyclase (GGDEF)-like protein